jgi:type VI secretion system secreted protein Hcp
MPIFGKFPGIDGEVTVKGYEKFIELISFSEGATKATSSGATHALKHAGDTEVTDCLISMHVDKSISNFFKQCCSGKPFSQEVEIHFTMSSGQHVESYLTYKFTSAHISHVHFSGHEPSETRGIVSLALTFHQIKIKYTERDPKTGQTKGHSEFGWDLAVHKEI